MTNCPKIEKWSAFDFRFLVWFHSHIAYPFPPSMGERDRELIHIVSRLSRRCSVCPQECKFFSGLLQCCMLWVVEQWYASIPFTLTLTLTHNPNHVTLTLILWP